MFSFLVAVIADDEAEKACKLEFSGVMESEFSYTMNEDNSESDLYLGKVELSADASLDSHFSGHLLFAYEHGENDENIALDEGSVYIKFPLISLSLGRVVIPFGIYDSHFVTDPFTLEMGELKQNAISISSSYSIVEACVALYNSRVSIDGEDNSHIRDFSAMIKGSTPEDALSGKASISLGISFISNSAGLESIKDMLGESAIVKRVAGINGFASLNIMRLFLNGEVIQTLDDLETISGEKIKPSSFNIELGYALPDIPVELAGKFEQVSQNEGDSTKRFGGVISTGFAQNRASLKLEVLRIDDGETTQNTITSQLAISF
jgi:hypothetical protein